MTPTDARDDDARAETRYWINVYTAGTWLTAQETGYPAAWFSDRNHKLIGELQVGDLIVCYVARIGFNGVLRATARPRRVDDGPFGEAFPVVVRAEPVVWLDLEEALPLSDMPSESPTHHDGTFKSWLIQGSGKEWPVEIGQPFLPVLQRWAVRPRRRQLTRRQLEYRPPALAMSSLGEVSVPVDEDSADDDPGTAAAPAPVTDHVRFQARLLRIGRTLGLTPWVTPDDQSKRDEHGTPLAQLPGVTTDLPRQFDEATNRTVRHIDVMWLRRNRVEAAFEVESTTSIYSGLLRMADLLALQPNINIPLYLVVPDDRLERALQELRRPVFRAMAHPLSESCRVITFSRLDDLEKAVGAVGGHVTPSVVSNFSVSAEQD